MPGWIWHILLTGIGSIVIILVIHALIRYIQDQYTTQKTKDLVHAHSEKYRKMLDEVLFRQQQLETIVVDTPTANNNNININNSLETAPLFTEYMETDLDAYVASITTILPNTQPHNTNTITYI